MSGPPWCRGNTQSCDTSFFTNFPWASPGGQTATQTVTVTGGATPTPSLPTPTPATSDSGSGSSVGGPASDTSDNSLSSSAQNKSGSPTATIVGGTLGGVAFILFALAFLYVLRRRRRGKMLLEAEEKGPHAHTQLSDQEANISSRSMGDAHGITPLTHSDQAALGGGGAGGARYPNEKAARRGPTNHANAYHSSPDSRSQTSTAPLITPSQESSFNLNSGSPANRAYSTAGTSDNPSLTDSSSTDARLYNILSLNPNLDHVVGAGAGTRRSISARTLAEQMAPGLSPDDLDRLADTIVARMQRPNGVGILPAPMEGSEIEGGTDSDYQEPPPPWRASWIGPPGVASGTEDQDGSNSSAQPLSTTVTSPWNQSNSTREIDMSSPGEAWPTSSLPTASSRSITSASSVKKSAITDAESSALRLATVDDTEHGEERAGLERRNSQKDGDQLRILKADTLNDRVSNEQDVSSLPNPINPSHEMKEMEEKKGTGQG